MADTPAQDTVRRAAGDAAALLDLARAVAAEAAEELLRRVGRVEGLAAKSTATDPVTDADRASEALIAARLTAARPDDGLLGEEGASRPSRSGLTWVVDPLDGTVNYLYGLGRWSVSIAVRDDAGTVAGVVHEPLAGRVFTAVRGAGARLTDAHATRELRIPPARPLEAALIATGFGYSAERRAEQARTLQTLLPEVRDIRRMGTAAVDLCSVALGEVDGYYERGIKWWDVAAGVLVVTEAGGQALVEPDPFTAGRELRAVAAAPALYRRLRRALVASGTW